MPAQHLKRLISDLHPGVSVRQLCLDAGANPNRIGHYLKPGTTVAEMPLPDSMAEIARILGCDLSLVVRAFARDVGIPWGEPADPNAARVLILFGRMSPEDRQTWLRVGESLAGGPLP